MYGNLMDIDVRQGGLRDGYRGLACLDGLASFFLSFLRSFLVGHYIALPPAGRPLPCVPHRLLDATAQLLQ